MSAKHVVGTIVGVMLLGHVVTADQDPRGVTQAGPGGRAAATPQGELAQMSGQPLFVNDLPVGIVTVRVVRGGMDAAVAQQRVELQGPGKMLVGHTDAQGRAQFGPLPVGLTTQAFTTLDGRQLMSAAFRIPAEGGTRLLLAPAAPDASSAAPALPLLSTAPDVPLGASPLAPMAGLPLQVPDLAPGVVSVRVVRRGFENPVVGHDVELVVGSGRPLRASTDAEGRALFPAQAIGAVVHANTIVDGETLESQAFPLPDRGGVRMVLVAGAGASIPAGGPAPEPPVGGGITPYASGVDPAEPPPTAADAPFVGLRWWFAAGLVTMACGVLALGRRRVAARSRA